MTMEVRKPRGPYAKGTAKRVEIIAKAIEAFGKTGYHGTSMREIATACGLSQAGLLHHFQSKEAILLAIVDYRETTQSDSPVTGETTDLTWQVAAMEQVRNNEENESLTRLWANLVGEATDPAHPAHSYFKNRYHAFREAHTAIQAAENDRETPKPEDAIKAQLLIALWDGLQTQWLLDETFDMKPAFEYALKMLSEYKAA
jgi:AcrR family transcriptional regulator